MAEDGNPKRFSKLLIPQALASISNPSLSATLRPLRGPAPSARWAMSKKVNIHVGTLDDMGKRFVNAWHRLERGERVRERHVTFPNLSAMMSALSEKRLELLREVHREPAPSVKALAERLGRDYKRVHEDVETLAASGLVRREEGRVSAPYDAISAEMRL